MIIMSPLSVPVARNVKFILNLNNFRNAHYQVLNTAKINYKALVAEQILKLPAYDVVKMHYTLYPESKRLTDIGNVISVHKKFFEDAMVELKKLPEDNYNHVVGSSESFGGVDKENPRVEIEIFGN